MSVCVQVSGPACLTHPWVRTPYQRGGHQDTQLWPARGGHHPTALASSRFTLAPGPLTTYFGGNANSFDPHLPRGICVRGGLALDPLLWRTPVSQAPSLHLLHRGLGSPGPHPENIHKPLK